jgi:ankyrin repeat protein
MGAKANYVDSLGQTPLFYVCRDGRIKLAQLLVQHGCDVNHLDTYGQTPFFYGVSQGHIELVHFLLEKGADHDHVDNNLQTPAFYAIKESQEANLKLLIERGVKIHQKDKKGVSLIMQAKKNTKKPQFIDILVKAGAEPLPVLEAKKS